VTDRRVTVGKILPKTADNGYMGHPIARWAFLALSIVSIGRSCIHLFSADGGAGSIAGIDLANGGAESIVFTFALWGLSQLIYGLIQLLVALRYRTLIPLMYLFLIFETIGRMLIGHFKPPVLLHVPPGGTADWILLPVAVVLLGLSLWERKKRAIA
jgi:hypothetical protein